MSRFWFLGVLTTFLFIEQCYSPCVNGYLANSVEVCSQFNDLNNYCCMLLVPSNSTNICYQLPKTQYKQQSSQMYLGKTYDMQCLTLSGGKPGSTCPNNNPTQLEDCSKQSTFDNSCCFYSLQGKNNCYWVGQIINGTITYQDLPMECGVEQLKVFTFYTVILYLGLFFLYL
jgi:hypothetical protein